VRPCAVKRQKSGRAADSAFWVPHIKGKESKTTGMSQAVRRRSMRANQIDRHEELCAGPFTTMNTWDFNGVPLCRAYRTYAPSMCRGEC
jgi:hypothetical protein